MIVRAARFLAVAFFAACASAHADVISEHPDNVAVTFYHEDAVDTSELIHAEENSAARDSGLAFITEQRTIDLPAGPTVVKFQGVASTMVPQTATIQGLPEGVLEQNFDYDLLSPGSLLAKSIGETVRLVRTDTKSGKRIEETAIIRSGPDGAVFEIDGKFEALRCSALPEKLVFEHVPGGLADTPTLSVRTMAPQAGRYTITLSYIATGMNWSADYVANVKPGTNRLELRGWLTLANFGATSFDHVPVSVVAGHLETTGRDRAVRAVSLALGTNCWPTNINWGKYPPPPPPPPAPGMMETVIVTAERREENVQSAPLAVVAQTGIEAQKFGDYKLYPLPEPVTVAARQTKQIQFLYQPDVAFDRVYRYSVYAGGEIDKNAKAEVVLRLHNRIEDGLGKPLPAGGVSVFETAPDGSPIFTGHDSIDDIANDLPMEIEMGRAMDVPVEARITESTTSGSGSDRKNQRKIEVTVENRKTVPIVFEFRQSAFEKTKLDSDDDFALESGNVVWRFHLAAGERRTLHYMIRWPA